VFFSPLSWTRRSALSREGVIPPVYWYRSKENKRLFVVPVYWSFHSPEQDLTILPPYYHWRKDQLMARGLFPLMGHHRGGGERGSYIFPFYWYNANDKGDSLWVIPPVLTYIQRHGGDKPSLNVQYLLLGNVQKRGDYLSHDFFPLYRYIRDKDYENFWRRGSWRCGPGSGMVRSGKASPCPTPGGVRPRGSGTLCFPCGTARGISR